MPNANYEYRLTAPPPMRASDPSFLPRVHRVINPIFGSDRAANWSKIPKTFGARYAYVGPSSEWDSAVLDGGAAGAFAVSVGNPCVIPFDMDIDVRPHRSFGNPNDDVFDARLDLVVLNYIPDFAPLSRPPRIYPVTNLDSSVNSSTETLMTLETKWLNGVARGVGTFVCIAGAKGITLFLRNTHATVGDTISWRLVGLDDQGGVYPISPNGYPTTTPTYNTLAVSTHEAYHLDVEIDSFSGIGLYAKSSQNLGSGAFSAGLVVRDGF